jgi:diadenosine tetraphosphate (Ap4A) HIT family hydrolase
MDYWMQNTTSKNRYNKLAVQSNVGNELNAVDGDKFTLDTRLANDSFLLAHWPLCDVRRFDDERYDWLMLIPRVDNSIEFTDLSAPQQQQLALEVQQVSLLLKQVGVGQKLNVGALGNVVSQLHVHLVMRHTDDPAWPGPVWGHSAAQRFAESARNQEIKRWQALL